MGRNKTRGLGTYEHAFTTGYWGSVSLAMVGLALLYLTVSIWLYKAVDHRARKTANLMRY